MKAQPRLLILLAMLGLTACGGSGSQSPGVSAITQTTHLSNSTANGEIDHETDPHGETSVIKPIYRDDNMYIDLQLGLVNLRAVELVKCESVVASVAKNLLNFLLSPAVAHSAHIPGGPAGVIDVLKPDLLTWDLGAIHPQAGSFCGLKLEIANLESSNHADMADEGEGAAESTSVNMTGKGVLVSPCYYPDTANTPQTAADSTFPHSCIEAAYSGEPIQYAVMFAEPITLNNERRSIHLMLATAYDNWFNGLDMTILETDGDEQARLALNVLKSFYLMEAN